MMRFIYLSIHLSIYLFYKWWSILSSVIILVENLIILSQSFVHMHARKVHNLVKGSTSGDHMRPV